MEFQHRYADVNGITLHYVSEGQGESIIFLHGFPACWYVWKPQLQQFSQSFRAIALDGRGVNRSSKPKQLKAYRIDVLAQDVIALADFLQIEKFILVGHDWGGVLAWRIAQSFPDRVKALVVANAPPLEAFLCALATLPEQRTASSYINRLKAETAETSLLANNCEHLWRVSFEEYMRRGYYNASDQTHIVNSWKIEGALTGFLNWYRANIPEFDAIQAKHCGPETQLSVKVPSLLLWGEHESAFTPQLLALISEYVPALEVIHVTNAGHWISLDQPALFLELVTNFIRQAT